MSELANGLASTTNTAPAAPPAPAAAESTPVSPPSFAGGSLSDAFAHFNVHDEPTAPTTEAPTSGDAPATVEPVAPTETVSGKEGPIPFQVHKTALENARTKERDAVMAEVTQQLASIKPVLPVAHAIARDVETGSIEGLNQLLKEYAAHPQLGPKLRSMFGRALAQMRGQGPAAEDAEPEADLQTADGQLVYSATQLAKRETWRQRQWEKQLHEKLAPFERIVKERETQAAEQQYVQQAMQGYQPYLAELKAMPGFTEHLTEIVARQRELFTQAAQAGQTADPMALLMRAYRDIAPAKLQAHQKAQLEASALQKAAGRDSNPAAVVGTPPPSPRSLSEAFQQVGLR